MTFIFPKSNKSGTIKNSITFMEAIIKICATEETFDLIRLKIHTVISTSKMPIAFVKITEYGEPKILATICWWRGTRSNILHKSPLTSHTIAIKKVRILWVAICNI